MIFIALGTQKFQLNRLLKAVDKLIEQGVVEEEVFAQTGHSDYVPQKYQYVNFLSKEDFNKKLASCSLMITHGGVGTIMEGLRNEKPIIVYPRLEKYKEHVDNHQLEIAESFSELNYVLLCKEEDDLSKVIRESRKHIFSKYISGRAVMIEAIKEYLKQADGSIHEKNQS